MTAPTLDECRSTLRAMLPELAERYGVAELGLFGSRVRGDHRPDSDLDVLVTFRPGHRISLLGVAGLELALEDRLGVPVDLVEADSLKPAVGRQVFSEVQYISS